MYVYAGFFFSFGTCYKMFLFLIVKIKFISCIVSIEADLKILTILVHDLNPFFICLGFQRFGGFRIF